MVTSRLAQVGIREPAPTAPHRWGSKIGILARYAAAVPFLAIGAAFMTVGALLAGNSGGHRSSPNRVNPGLGRRSRS
jgi:hypothetical protein